LFFVFYFIHSSIIYLKCEIKERERERERERKRERERYGSATKEERDWEM
jgi:hypothetical protein